MAGGVGVHSPVFTGWLPKQVPVGPDEDPPVEALLCSICEELQVNALGLSSKAPCKNGQNTLPLPSCWASLPDGPALGVLESGAPGAGQRVGSWAVATGAAGAELHPLVHLGPAL